MATNMFSAGQATHHDRVHTNLTIIIHPQGPGPVVLNISLSQPGMETVNTVPSNALVGVTSTGVDSATSDSCGSTADLNNCGHTRELVPQPNNERQDNTAAVTMDDSATESETESEREYLRKLFDKQNKKRRLALGSTSCSSR